MAAQSGLWMGIDAGGPFALETSMRIRGDATASAGGAARFDSRVWRDPRLLVGATLILASTVLGGFAVAAADHTVAYWAMSGRVRPGDPVERGDFVAVRVKVPKRTAQGLLRTSDALPSRLDRLSWAAAARSGALVTRDMLEERHGAIELPLVVPIGNAPADLRPGDRIDVWTSVAGKGEAAASTNAQRILSRVRVLHHSSAGTVSGASGVSVVVDVAGLSLSGRIVGAATSGRVTLVRVP